MRDALTALIEKYWATFGVQRPYDKDAISITKFCQRVVQPHTKVLFFVSFRGAPLCIMKTVRTPACNGNLLREATHQAVAPHTAVLSAPKVYWVDQVGDRAVYAEEYIDAVPVSISDYRALGPHITEFVQALPRYGSIRSDDFIAQIAHLLPEDPVVAQHAHALTDAKVDLVLGLTHGDLGRQNILGTAGRAWIVDWERSGDIPIHTLDLVSYCERTNQRNLYGGLPSFSTMLSIHKLVVGTYTRHHAHYQRIARTLGAKYVIR